MCCLDKDQKQLCWVVVPTQGVGAEVRPRLVLEDRRVRAEKG